jgi:hypothetical protein
MDIRVREELDLKALPALLTKYMPEGIRVTGAWEGGLKSTGLKWLRVRGVLAYDGGEDGARAAALRSLFERPSLPVLRRTKSGESEFDLKSGLRELAVADAPEGVEIEAVLSAQDPSVNPELMTAALRRHAPRLPRILPVLSAWRRIGPIWAYFAEEKRRKVGKSLAFSLHRGIYPGICGERRLPAHQGGPCRHLTV